MSSVAVGSALEEEERGFLVCVCVRKAYHGRRSVPDIKIRAAIGISNGNDWVERARAEWEMYSVVGRYLHVVGGVVRTSCMRSVENGLVVSVEHEKGYDETSMEKSCNELCRTVDEYRCTTQTHSHTGTY